MNISKINLTQHECMEIDIELQTAKKEMCTLQQHTYNLYGEHETNDFDTYIYQKIELMKETSAIFHNQKNLLTND